MILAKFVFFVSPTSFFGSRLSTINEGPLLVEKAIFIRKNSTPNGVLFFLDGEIQMCIVRTRQK